MNGMMNAITNLIVQAMPYLVIAVIVWAVLKNILAQLPSKKSKEQETTTMDERIYKMIIGSAKQTNLKKHASIKLTGDQSTPAHKIGEVVGGIVKKPEAIFIPKRKKWWKFWGDDIKVLVVESDLVTDLFDGDLLIEGAGLDPVTNKFTWVNTATDYGSEYDDEEVQEKRLKLTKKLFAQVGTFDTNNDVWDNTKTALRGDRAAARKELVRPDKPVKKEQEQLQREKKEELERIHKKEERGDIYSRGEST